MQGVESAGRFTAYRSRDAQGVRLVAMDQRVTRERVDLSREIDRWHGARVRTSARQALVAKTCAARAAASVPGHHAVPLVLHLQRTGQVERVGAVARADP